MGDVHQVGGRFTIACGAASAAQKGCAKSIAVICRRTCRAGRSSSSRQARSVPAAAALHVVREVRSERLDKVPATYRVIVTRQPKYACRTCERIGTDEGGLPTEGLAADLVVSKYTWHLPLYRQSQMMDAGPLGRIRGLRADAHLRNSGRDLGCVRTSTAGDHSRWHRPE